MGDKLNLTTVSSGYQDTASLNANFDAIEQAIDNTLSRDGSTPNQMESDLDMNGNSIINAVATGSTDVNFVHVGDWAVTTSYSKNNIVYLTVALDASNGGASYVAKVDHTSTGSFANDLASDYWQLLSLRGASGGGSGDMLAANNLSDVANASTSRSNLGLGTAAIYNHGVSATNEIFTTTNQYTEAALTISGGSVTPSVVKNSLAPQGGTSDTLDTITNTNLMDGGVLRLRVANSTHTITISHGTGNIYLKDSLDYVIDTNNQETITLERRGTDWFEVSRSRYSSLELITVDTLSTDTDWESPTLSAAYSQYKFVLSNVYSSTNADNLVCTFQVSGGSYQTSLYRYGQWRHTTTAVDSTQSTSTSSITLVASQIGDSSGESINGEIIVTGHRTSSGYTKVMGDIAGWDPANSQMFRYQNHGFRNNAEEIDKIKLALGSGTLTGTITVYGLRAS